MGICQTVTEHVGRSKWRALCAVTLLSVLAGCASIERHEAPGAPASLATVKPLDISGRISLRQGREGHAGGVRWFFDPPHHDIRVLSPLGQTMARIVENPQGVTLTTADNQSVRADDPDQLIAAVLGWRLPIRGMQHWVLGQASPDSKAQTETNGDNHVARIRQDNWDISYANYRNIEGTALPGRIVMRRADIEVRFVVDSWKPVLRSQ